MTFKHLSIMRFLVGSLVCIKKCNQKAIVVGDYAFLHGYSSCDVNYDLCLALLNDDGEIENFVSWFSLDDVDMLFTSDEEHMKCLAKLYEFSHREI